MEMNGFKLCKLIRRNVQAWLMVYLSTGTPQGKQIMTHLEKKGFAFHSSGVSFGEI